MNVKHRLIPLLSALMLLPAGSKLAAAPLLFFFSGQITDRRATNSVFTDPNTDQFYGYFSYDPAATVIAGNLYPLLSFSVDGNPLNSTNGTFVHGIPSISVSNDPFYGGGDSLEIRGIYPPAASNPSDYGTTGIWFTDSSGLVFTNNSLPTSLSLSSFNSAWLQGPIALVIMPPKTTFDAGIITQLTLVPEPTSCGLLGLGLVTAIFTKRRHV